MTVKTVRPISPPRTRPRAAHRKPRPAASSRHWWSLAWLVLLAVLVPVHGLWAAQLVLLAVLLVFPGVLLLRALRVPGATIASFPAYVPGASLVVLLGSGLAVDLVGPLLGVSKPLRPEPLLGGLVICCLALHGAGLRAGPESKIPWSSIASPARIAWPLTLPLLAAAGAELLNNGHTGAVALIAVFGCAVALIGGFLLASRLDNALLTALIYASALALMWGFSLRGDLVYGYDIASEYNALQHTLQAGVWHTSHVGDAYGALLSVTVLPAELHLIAGAPALMVFKAVYPAIGALLPVMVFHVAKQILTRRWAFAAAVMTAIQGAFFQELPGLARQEISLVLFGILIAIILDRGLTRRPQLALAALFGLAMGVSHYTTTYFAIAMFAFAVALQWIVSWFRPVPRVTPVLALSLVTVTICAGAWYALITKSASNLSQFLNAASGGLNLLPAQGSGGLLSRYLAAGSQVTVSAAEYAKDVAGYYAAHLKWVHPLPGASNPVYALQNSAQPKPAVRWQLGLSAVNELGLIIEQLMNIVAAIGALMMVLRRDSSIICRQMGLLGLGTLGILVLLRLSGTAATAYNPERAFLQALVVLGISMCWLLQLLASKTRKRQLTMLAVTAAAVAVFLGSASGLTGAVLGGGVKTNLANSGTDYEQFDMTTPELAAAAWVGKMAPPSQPIYSDHYGQLRLYATIGDRRALLTEVTPRTLNEVAWIYADRTNVLQRTGLGFFQNDAASYAFPFGYLNSHFDLVYTVGSSEVYFR